MPCCPSKPQTDAVLPSNGGSRGARDISRNIPRRGDQSVEVLFGHALQDDLLVGNRSWKCWPYRASALIHVSEAAFLSTNPLRAISL